MSKHPQKPIPATPRTLHVVEHILFVACLCLLALRTTYTEAPAFRTVGLSGSLDDSVYSLTVSGLLIFAFVLWLVWCIASGTRAYRFTGLEIGLILFCLAALIAGIGASDKRLAITHAMVLLGPIFTALLFAQILDGSTRTTLLLVVVAALGLVSTYQCAEQFFNSNAITIEQYEKNPQMLLGPLGIEPGTFPHFLFEHRLYGRGIRGFFTTSNSAASFTILASAAAAVLLIRRLQDCKARQLEPRYGLFALLAAVIIIAGLFSTQSKGGILAFFAGLAVCGLFVGIDHRFGSQKRRILMVLVPLLLLLAAGAGCALVLYGLKHGRLPGGNSMLVRWQYWVAWAQMYAEHPLTGIGPGNFSGYYTHYKPAAALESVADPHNFLLSLIIQYGPLGLVSFLAMVFVPLWRSIVASATAPISDARPQSSFGKLALAILLTVCACLLLVRLLLIPMTAESPDVLLYELVTMHVAPVAAFLIGFLLVAAPLNDHRGGRADFAGVALPAVLGSAILAVLLHNLIDFALFEPGVWMAFWITIACLIAMRVQQQTGFRITASRARVLRPLASGVAIALLVSYCLWVWKPAYDVALGIQRAQQAASGGNFDAAHHYLEAATRKDPLSPVAANFNGRLYLQQYEQLQVKQPALLEDAARCFTEAIERNPADYKNYEKLAMVYSRLGQPQKAYDGYLKGAGLYPGCERLWFELAQTAEQLGKAGLALCHYTKAVEIEDSYRQQFRRMYPDRDKVVSRLGDKEYQHAKKRIEELSK